MVDGQAARALGDLARTRWLRATSEPAQADAELEVDRWPEGVAADLTDVEVGINRTMPRWRDEPGVRENETLYLAGIASAQQLLYFENQYLASSMIGDALEQRLADPDGPEIVVSTGEHAPSFFDSATMDPQRDALIRRLRTADRYGRFHPNAPHAPEGRPVLMHSKLMILDDRLVRIGSSNTADRSLGYNIECDLALKPVDLAGQENIAELRQRLVAHFLRQDAEEVWRTVAAKDSLVAAIEGRNRSENRRRRPLDPPAPGFPRSFVAKFHLGDPTNRAGAWRP